MIWGIKIGYWSDVLGWIKEVRRFGSWWLATILSTRVLIHDSSNGGFLLFAATTTALGLAQLLFMCGALSRMVNWSGSEAIYLFATFNQQNAHYCSLDIYITISHWILLRFLTNSLRDTGMYFFVTTTVVLHFVFYMYILYIYIF
jgi:hypothetical protein